MRTIGIDEAGLGPVLGPLVVVALCGDAAELFAFGARDSKAIHRAGDLQPLARIVLPILAASGTHPRTIGDVLRWAGIDPRTRPWLAAADVTPVPGSAVAADWSASESSANNQLSAMSVLAQAVDAETINDPTYATKAVVETAMIGPLLRTLCTDEAARITIDRLGGRKFYAGLLTEWFGILPSVLTESPAESCYELKRSAPAGAIEVRFAVAADADNPLVGAASCVAKFVRECWMLVFNQWWCAHCPGLAATAGYPEDGKRWLAATRSQRDRADDVLLIRKR